MSSNPGGGGGEYHPAPIPTRCRKLGSEERPGTLVPVPIPTLGRCSSSALGHARRGRAARAPGPLGWGTTGFARASHVVRLQRTRHRVLMHTTPTERTQYSANGRKWWMPVVFTGIAAVPPSPLAHAASSDCVSDARRSSNQSPRSPEWVAVHRPHAWRHASHRPARNLSLPLQ